MACDACRDITDGRLCPWCGASANQTVAVTTDSSSDSATPPSMEQARFIPGTMVGGRYRIVNLIGRGGMGDVYRAEDLKLGQAVALKFLPAQFARDPDRLLRFQREVRVARQISHPNVCRVYDIGDADGQHFLSMEYIDGEDLASLLRRIGRLPPDKALVVARQLCAGLAAAHEREVLHRDLKPANVLLDGRGHVRVADFGLASIVGDRHDASVIAGTPAYMAPEQLAGAEASVRSDVYALGLVLHEVFTGRRAFEAGATHAGGGRAVLAALSRHLPDIDPAIDRVVISCLDPDPSRRPASAIAVAAALPGRDPLAAALAAGETPSPEMVAAAGDRSSIPASQAVTCVVGIVIGLLLIGWLSQRTTLTSFVSFETGVEGLAERARRIIRDLGYTEAPRNVATGFNVDISQLEHVQATDASPERWDRLRSGPSPVRFWYRESPSPLEPYTIMDGRSDLVRVTPVNPPNTEPGMVRVYTDLSGRLVGLRAVPTVAIAGGAATSAAEWGPRLFEKAGLAFDEFKPAVSSEPPPVYADSRQAWIGAYTGRPDIPIRVEVAALGGRPVYFQIVAPWTQPETRLVGFVPRSAVAAGIFIAVIIAAVVLARRNIRRGRVDRRRAFRLSTFVGVATAAAGVSSAHDPGALFSYPAFELFGAPILPWAVWLGVIACVTYYALEPHLRRIWPEMLIGWNRLLGGEIRDPLVGRDILIGTLVGVVTAALAHIGIWLPPFFDVAAPPPLQVGLLLTLILPGVSGAVTVYGSTLVNSIGNALSLVFMLLLATAIFRGRRGVAAMVVVAILVAVFSNGDPVALVFSVLVFAIPVVIAFRFGILATTVSMLCASYLTMATFDFRAGTPYVFANYLFVGTVIVFAVYGFQTARAGRPLLGRDFLEAHTARP